MATLTPIWRTKTDTGTAGRKGGPALFGVPPQKYHRTPQRPARSVGLFLGVWLLSLCPVVQQVSAQEAPEIAKQAQNPIASLISVPIENDFNPQTGIKKEDSYVLEMKPVIPFTLSKDWNLITRTVIPVIQVPDLAPGVNGTTGVGDVQLSLFLSPAKAGAVIWGAGPVISFPTASQEILGTKKLSAGPTVVVRAESVFFRGTIGTTQRESDALATLRKLQPQTWVVSNVITDHYRELGS